MAAFPHTAPIFTQEDRDREFASLTEDELDRIEKDKFGIESDEDDCDEEKEWSLLQMEEELENIPLEEKMDYMAAVIKVPELVERESPMLNFLRKHHHNATAAARNMILYWKCRVQLFGDEKSFLPMTIRGALRDDYDSLSTGFCQILPQDDRGRTVIYHEKKRANTTVHHRDSLCRVVFYMHHVASMDSRAQQKGFIGLNNLRGTLMKDLDRLYSKRAYNIMENVAAVRCASAHMASPKLWLFPASVIMPVFDHVVPPALRWKSHFYDCISELENYGISLNIIPISMGGKYDNIDNFQIWIETQIEKEERNTYQT
mmetsp:Transcript_8081/g.11582  ORF Transcript_8081/g.11582 Transcript_8081/m.11582 type:complete len:316 (+) Transcript_8081:36-983(+)